MTIKQAIIGAVGEEGYRDILLPTPNEVVLSLPAERGNLTFRDAQSGIFAFFHDSTGPNWKPQILALTLDAIRRSDQHRKYLVPVIKLVGECAWHDEDGEIWVCPTRDDIGVSNVAVFIVVSDHTGEHALRVPPEYQVGRPVKQIVAWTFSYENIFHRLYNPELET